MGESRTELLAWLNDLTQLGFTKIEQCGTGVAHCVIMDSIYRDVPLSKCKFSAKHEYEYIQNFKVLQNVFDKHKISNAIPVERLVKCRFQDNLEFLQWMKKYWDQYYPGGNYDAVARRGSASLNSSTSSLKSPSTSSPQSKTTASMYKAPTTKAAGSSGSMSAGVPKSSTGRIPGARAAPAASGAGGSMNSSMNSVNTISNTNANANAAARVEWERERAEMEQEYQRMLSEMNQQAVELRVSIEQVEKEREFYFGKLREIEIFVQSQVESGAHGGHMHPVEETLRQIQSIMYKTEDGFEIPADGGAGEVEEEMY